MSTHRAAQRDAARVPTAVGHATAWSARHVAAAAAWVLVPHDDRVPSAVQHVLWFAALVVVFVAAARP